MKECNLEGCSKEQYLKGFCRRHYKSLSKYGDANRVEENAKIRVEKRAEKEKLLENPNITRRGTVRKAFSTNGICSVEGCETPIKAKKLCDMHYARQLRNGSLERKAKINIDLETCLVIGCERKHFRNGLCNSHYGYQTRYKTPYLAKTIKLCGVKGCEEIHLAKGLCKKHYDKWSRIMKEHGMEWNGMSEVTVTKIDGFMAFGENAEGCEVPLLKFHRVSGLQVGDKVKGNLLNQEDDSKCFFEVVEKVGGVE